MSKKAPLHVPQFTDTLNLSPPSPSMCFPSPNKNDKRDKQQQHQGLCGCQRAPKSHCISAIGVLILVLLYTAMGSIIFVTLESEIEDIASIETAVAESKHYTRTDLEDAEKIRNMTVDKLWSITESLNVLYKDNWTKMADDVVRMFQDNLLRAVRASKIQEPGVQPSIPSHKWSYASAFLYSLTLITTIGYGGISPRTQWGRIAALIYALFGIPIVLLYLSAMGEGLSSAIRCLFRVSGSSSGSSNSKKRGNSGSSGGSNKTPPLDSSGTNTNNSNTNGGNAASHLHFSHHQHHQHSSKLHNSNNSPYQLHSSSGLSAGSSNLIRPSHTNPSVPISICILILICYISLGALLFHKIQNWSVLESLYFCFTSLGTIGSGDLSPTGNLSQYLASGYIIFGMAVVAMCFSLIQTELILWLRKFGVQDQVLPPSSSSTITSSSSNPNNLLGGQDDVALVSVSAVSSVQSKS
ncbi:TWiK family of potassium channels protein 7-like [Condylostylus longicornis]|uniref:TWiK family of potassium channels protein 7-like n=1 Tax=Condylostylus longicornis TaxID=2530218 RepID=UPI00244E20AE|nr:TWiK family of potassium channels protein 7-like [Condylostylus longicornis]XP_055374898.1 TWiK family of potassium channels protein 7-like [Condylostylus longicornis]XP_055374899.1 TWiK family of potassium channels protein 7-like [Condylostylus longicornis]XP_055374900.1 TWiK family of potassium channels protein 7-like [Condylostylus longicornis]